MTFAPGMEMLELGGFHHLTAVSADIRENVAFYTRTIGMRLVKRTVNQDDVRMSASPTIFYSRL